LIPLLHLTSLRKLQIFDNALRGWKLAALPHVTDLVLMGSDVDVTFFQGCSTLRKLTIDGPLTLKWLNAPELCASLHSLTLYKACDDGLDMTQILHILHLKHIQDITIDPRILPHSFESSPEWAQLRLPCAALPSLHTLTLKES
jgi:hypothetical protein